MANGTILIVGSGAREHVIAEQYIQSYGVHRIIVGPGNGFIKYAIESRFEDVRADLAKGVSLKDPQSVLAAAREFDVEFVDVAQDDALAAGTVDLLRQNGIPAFGPTQAAARIEWDKAWSRDFMKRHSIPTPEFAYFNSDDHMGRLGARSFAKDLFRANKLQGPIYIKAAGLYQGKGAIRADNLEQAEQAIEAMRGMEAAGRTFVVEQGLVGEEFSIYAITDGTNYRIFRSAQDNKRANNFDLGDQTGGMGAISSARVTRDLDWEIEHQLVAPAIHGLREEGHPFTGILYVSGIRLADSNEIAVIEYNSRWGDPEVQAVMQGIEHEDYLGAVRGCLEGKLDLRSITEHHSMHDCCVVGSSRGYPGDYSSVKGKEIFGLKEVLESEIVNVYGASITVRDGRFFANGGRLFSLVGSEETLQGARKQTLEAMAGIHIEGNGLHYRTDIGWRDVERELKEQRTAEQ